ncbi:uncharacterized protein LOC129921690 isoform X2 [Biomphalaria glabrata]|uniref:Uncharacterized protein LOC129921690 isoform X2 n=1 Tax=Biomphalaria glabrata TaxID=6526 RepID=A0A9W2YB98_BIOGL|nr:uncharacterized protein LOC129921690 isoform X2 [Biomphalaria glabrata]
MEADEAESTSSIIDAKHTLESDTYLIFQNQKDASINIKKKRVNNKNKENGSTFNCCFGKNEVNPKSEKQEDIEQGISPVGESTPNQKANDQGTEKPIKLIVKLVGSVLEESDEGYCNETDHNLRNFLFPLIKLLKKEECCLVLPKGNNKTLYNVAETIIQSKIKGYENIKFSTKKDDFVKYISDFKTLECLIVYDGTKMDGKEQEVYKNNNTIILKESENLTRFDEPSKDKDVPKSKGKTGKIHSKNYVTININETWTESSIAQKILQSFLGKGIIASTDFRLLCIRLNHLDLAVQHGGLWKFKKSSSQASDDNKKSEKQFVLLSIQLERFEFIKYLIQQGVQIKEYLNEKDIIDDAKKDIEHLKVKYSFKKKEQEKQKQTSEKSVNQTDQSSNTRDDSEECNLFICAVLAENFKLALILWRTLSRPTIAALYAIEIINDLKALYEKDLSNHPSKLDKEIRNFEDLAISTLNKTYATNPDIVYDLLICRLKGSWNGYSCVDLALLNNLGKFLSQTPCILLNEEMWNNDTVPRNSRFEQANIEPTKTSKNNCCISMLSKLRVPRKIAFLRFISHLVFLGFFAIWIISFLAVDTLHWIEWVLFTWVIFYLAEIVNQCILNVMRHRWSCWSFIDRIELFSVLLFLFSWILHIAAYIHQDNQQLMDCVLTLFSIDFMFFCIFTLEFCYIKQSLGPRLIVFVKMAEILCQFLLIIFAFFIAFAVSSQAVLYPNTQLTGLLFFRIFKRPFWSIFGDLTLDEFEPNVECTDDAKLYYDYKQLRCPSDVGSYYVPITMGIYVIIVNILLFNLIIALFNSAIKTNEEETEELWHRQFMSFTCEHSILLFMMPPITLLFRLLPQDDDSSRRYPFHLEGQDLEKMTKLASIETEQRDIFLEEVEGIIQNSVSLVKPTVVSQDIYYIQNSYQNTYQMDKEIIEQMQKDIQWIKQRFRTLAMKPINDSIKSSDSETVNDSITLEENSKSENSESSKEEVEPSTSVSRSISIGPEEGSDSVSDANKIEFELLENSQNEVYVTPVSDKANAILNEKYRCKPNKRFYAIHTNYSNSPRWVIRGVRVPKRRYEEDQYSDSNRSKSAREQQKFKNGPMAAVSPLL